MPFVSSIDNEKTYYEVLGDGDFSLVFISGWAAPNARLIWKYQLKFASEYILVLIDLSGYRKSDNARKIHTMELYGHDVKSVVEKLDLKDVILCGQSMGGAVILEAAKLIPNRILGLIPMDALFLDSFFTFHDEEKTNTIVKPFEENFVEATLNLMKNFVSDKFDPKDLKAWEDAIHEMDANPMISAFREGLKWDFRDILPEIENPIKCIVAGRTLTTKEERERYKEIFDTVFLEDLGHWMYLEDPEKFNAVFANRIREFQ